MNRLEEEVQEMIAKAVKAKDAELTALRAERDELRANIEAALFAIEPNRGDLSTNQRQALDNLRAVLAKYQEAE